MLNFLIKKPFVIDTKKVSNSSFNYELRKWSDGTVEAWQKISLSKEPDYIYPSIANLGMSIVKITVPDISYVYTATLGVCRKGNGVTWGCIHKVSGNTVVVRVFSSDCRTSEVEVNIYAKGK